MFGELKISLAVIWGAGGVGADGEGVLSSQDPREVDKADGGVLIRDQALVIREWVGEGGRWVVAWGMGK